jgi:two-component system OmpR family response regulator
VRLLIVEDDDIVADAITRGLTAANYSVLRVSSAEAAQAVLAGEEFAMAVIDVGLPGADGLTLVRRLRSTGKSLPTLILTARCTLTDKVKALDLGADDFLSKPFEAAELAARCRALMRRSNGALNGVVKLNRMSVDLVGRRLRIDEAEVELTASEWLVLECLVRRVGLIVSKEHLQQAVANPNPDHDITPNAIEVHISRLRAKLGTAAVVRSLRGLGYRLEDAKSA